LIVDVGFKILKVLKKFLSAAGGLFRFFVNGYLLGENGVRRKEEEGTQEMLEDIFFNKS